MPVWRRLRRGCGALLVGFDRHRLFGERDGAEPPLPPARRLALAGSKVTSSRVDDAVGETRLDVGEARSAPRDDAAGAALPVISATAR